MAQRIWLITGISSGFGRHLTEQLLDRGDRVVGTVRRPDAVADLVETIPTCSGRGARRPRHGGAEGGRRAHRRRPRPDRRRGQQCGLRGVRRRRGTHRRPGRRDPATNLTASIQLIRAVLPHMRAAGRRPHHSVVQLRRPGRVPGQLHVPRHQMGHRGLLRVGGAGGRTVRDRRDDRRAWRRAYRIPLRQCSGRRRPARICGNPGAFLREDARPG